MMAETHAFFITWSYVGAGVLTFSLIAYIVWDALRVKQKLAQLEKSGIRRRSSGTTAS
jgi:heme exporter protein CcmD